MTELTSETLSSLTDAHGFQQAGAVSSVEPADDGATVTFETGARLRLRFLADDVLRVRLAPTGSFSDGFSYALDPETTWNGPSVLHTEPDDAALVLHTPALAVRLDRATGLLSVRLPDGRVLLDDAAAPSWRMGTNGRSGEVEAVALSKTLRPGERLFGLGDKPLALNRRGHRVEHWNTDAFRYQRGTDPIYKSIPFVLGVTDGGAEPLAYGLFLDSFARSTLDLGVERHDVLRAEAEDRELVYTLMHAPEPLGVIERFARLTGRTPMLPKWALGYHQCRYSYQNEGEIREVAHELRSRRIPCDTLYFDIHYMDGYRVFTWDTEAFPDPAGLIADLRRDGFTSVVIIDPGVKADDPNYAVHQDGLARDVYVKYPDGTPFEGHVWPGLCHFPDYTDPEVRAWWGNLHQSLLDVGVDGVWNDMNEPAVFTIPGSEEEASTMPDEVRHACDGHPTDHRHAHNIYGTQMLRATYEGLERLAPERRPFTITRAAYAGAQRYGTAWTGDNSATWDHLRLAIQQVLSLGVSGMPFTGSDVGGFCEEPTGELLARWTQVGALTPLFRNHSAIDTAPQEPWRFGEEVERVCREAIELRYRLLPYLYGVLREAATSGLPMLRPLPLVHPSDETIRATSPDGFYIGADLLAQPVTVEGQTEREVYLPEAVGGWFDVHTGEHLAGRSTHWIETPLDRLPLYARAGAVLPLGPVVQSTAELGDQPLTLRVFAHEGALSGTVYEDAGDGWTFRDGDFYLATFEGAMDRAGLRLDTRVEGTFQPNWSSWQVEVMGLAARPEAVEVGGESVDFAFEEGVLRFEAAVSSSFTVRF